MRIEGPGDVPKFGTPESGGLTREELEDLQEKLQYLYSYPNRCHKGDPTYDAAQKIFEKIEKYAHSLPEDSKLKAPLHFLLNDAKKFFDSSSENARIAAWHHICNHNEFEKVINDL